MTIDYFPFFLRNQGELNFPIDIFENSRVKIELEIISQELVDKVFPNEGFVKLENNVSYPYTIGTSRMNKTFKEFCQSNTILKIIRKPSNFQEPQKYNRYVNAIIDSVLIVKDTTLTRYLIENKKGDINGYGSVGNHRQPNRFINKISIESEEIEEIKNLFKLILNTQDKKIDLSLELIRNADVKNHNSFGLKCSLLVIIVESFLLEGIRKDYSNFGKVLHKYLGERNESELGRLYKNRGKYFHSGEDLFDVSEWYFLKKYVHKIIIDFMEDKTKFQKYIKQIHIQEGIR